jgi:hypothetical protein
MRMWFFHAHGNADVLVAFAMFMYTYRAFAT